MVSRTTAFAFKGTTTDVRTIGSRLSVGAVLEGSVRRAGRRLRLSAQLVDVRTDSSSGPRPSTGSWRTSSPFRTRSPGPSSRSCRSGCSDRASPPWCGPPRPTSRPIPCTSRDGSCGTAAPSPISSARWTSWRKRWRGTRPTPWLTPGWPTATPCSASTAFGDRSRPSAPGQALRTPGPRDRAGPRGGSSRAGVRGHVSRLGLGRRRAGVPGRAPAQSELCHRAPVVREFSIDPRPGGRRPGQLPARRGARSSRRDPARRPGVGVLLRPGSTSPRSTSAGARSRSTRNCRSRTTGSPW